MIRIVLVMRQIHTKNFARQISIHVLLALCLCLTLVACAPRWEPPPGYRGGILAGAPPPARVMVRDGDSVYLIARRYNVPMKAIIEVNELRPPYVLQLGQVLRLNRPMVHKVSSGDSLYAISRQYGVDMRAIAQANAIAAPYTIFPGQQLMISGSYTAAATTSLSAPQEPQRATGQETAAPRIGPSSVAPTAPKPPPVAPPPPPSRVGSRFQWPVNGRIVSEYGPAGKGLHNDGINIAVAPGTSVRAAENGVVAYSGNELQGFGNLLLIKHADGWMSAYAHNDQLLVLRGEMVKQGQVISRSGESGSVRSPQLHFELRRGTKAVNPLDYLASQRS
ncbi:MAG: M23 family metallopeptidase [Rhodospirillaceae bacterium]|nr:M23 family metallopeptidase [Rhodospirillaceae bacterium]